LQLPALSKKTSHKGVEMFHKQFAKQSKHRATIPGGSHKEINDIIAKGGMSSWELQATFFMKKPNLKRTFQHPLLAGFGKRYQPLAGVAFPTSYIFSH